MTYFLAFSIFNRDNSIFKKGRFRLDFIVLRFYFNNKNSFFKFDF